MGLLDAFNMDNLGSDQGLLGLALLSAAAPKAGGRTSLGEGLLGGMQMVQAQKRAREEAAMKAQMQQAQMGLLGAQLQEHQMKVKAAEEAAAQDRAFQQALQANGTTPSQALAGGGGPTPQNAAQIGQQQPLDYAQLARMFPGRVDLIRKLAEAPDFGRSEVARVLEQAGPGGMPQQQQYDKFGRPVGGAVNKPVEMRMADTGGAQTPYNPFTISQALTKTNSPDSLLSANVTMRGQNMTDARSREANAISAEMKGLQRDELRMKLQDQLNAKEGAAASYETAVSTLDRLASHKGLSAAVGAKNPLAGSFGFYTVPGTAAADFNAELEAFKSQTFLPMVQSLRGMGALSDAEGKKLTAAVGALDQSMSEREFKASAARIKADLEAAYKRTTGGRELMPRATGDVQPVRRYNPDTGRIE